MIGDQVMLTIIATFPSSLGEYISQLRQLGCDKLIFLHCILEEGVVQEIVTHCKNSIPGIEIEPLQFDRFNLVASVKVIRKTIINSYNDGEQVAVGLFGGNQKLALAATLACYIENDKVDRLFYLSEDLQIIPLPVIRWRLSGTKQQILREFSDMPEVVENLAGKLGISQTMTYKHLKDLTNAGYLKKTMYALRLTPLGAMWVLLP